MNHDLKTRPRVKRLRKQLAALLWELRADRRKPRPTVRELVFRAFQEGIKPTAEDRARYGIGEPSQTNRHKV